MYRLLFFLTLLVGTAAPTNAQIRDASLGFEHIGVRDGLSNENITEIIQDADGFLWIGTLDGLNRYDGYEMRRYFHNPDDTLSLYDTYINEIALSNEGGFWVGTGSGVERYDAVMGAFRRLVSSDSASGLSPPDSYGDILEDRDGRLWAAGDRGLRRLDPTSGEVTVFPVDPDDPSQLVHRIVQ